MSTRVFKTDLWQVEEMYKWPESVRPPDLRREQGGYSYEMIVAQPITHWVKLHALAMRLWDAPGERQSISPNIYVDHIAELDPWAARIIEREIRACRWTPVTHCHGDLTIQNALGGRLFDPCRTWGLPCRELDESKMMQSGEGLCRLYRGFPLLDMTGFTPRRIHYALLMSHYVRMIPHVDKSAQEFARERISWLGLLLEENPWNESV